MHGAAASPLAPAPGRAAARRLVDAHGRVATDLRVSVTDRCDLRCSYCMPAEGLPWLPKPEVLTVTEIERLVGVLVGLGVRTVRLTGGEPLVRRELPEIVAAVRDLGVDDLALTTNGVLLHRHLDALIDAGLQRINVSLDTIDPERFRHITRRDSLERVLAGLRAVEARPELTPVKVNAVLHRDSTRREDVVALAGMARERPFEVRFIEAMPLDASGAWRREDVVTADQARAWIEDEWALRPLGRARHATATRYRFADGAGTIAVLAPVTEPFCGDCDRLRLTADGKLRTCLFSTGETDLAGPLRAGAGDDALAELLLDAVWEKPAGHGIDEPGFVRPARSMSRIGG